MFSMIRNILPDILGEISSTLRNDTDKLKGLGTPMPTDENHKRE